jgi:hypothetical protein
LILKAMDLRVLHDVAVVDHLGYLVHSLSQLALLPKMTQRLDNRLSAQGSWLTEFQSLSVWLSRSSPLWC